MAKEEMKKMVREQRTTLFRIFSKVNDLRFLLGIQPKNTLSDHITVKHLVFKSSILED